MESYYPQQQRSDDPTVASAQTAVIKNTLSSGGPVASTMEQPIAEQPIRRRNWCGTSVFLIILVGIAAGGIWFYVTTREDESVKSIATTDSLTFAPTSGEEPQTPTVVAEVPTPMPSTATTSRPTASPTITNFVPTVTAPSVEEVVEEQTPTLVMTTPPTVLPTIKSPTSGATPTTNSNSVPTVPNLSPTFRFFTDEFLDAFLPSSADEEFYWIEFLTYKEIADYNDGLVTTVPGESSDNVYKRWITEDVLPNIDGAEMLFHAKVVDAVYDDVIVIKYPSGQAFEQYVLESDDLEEAMSHRMAGVDTNNSILMATRLLIDDVPELLRQAPNANDISSSNSLFFETLHYRDVAVDPVYGITSLTGREAIETFDELSAPLKAKYGIRAAGWFEVESVAMFDSKQKPDQIRFEFVPSYLSFGGLLGEEGQAEIWEYNWVALLEHSIGAFTDVDEDSTLFNLYN